MVLSSTPLTILDLSDVSHNDLGHVDLDHLTSSDHRELLLLLDAVLEATELFLFTPVVEGRHQNHTDHRQQDGGAFDPTGLCLAVVFDTACRCPTV